MDKYASNSNQSVIVIKNHHKKGSAAMHFNLNKYQHHKVFFDFLFHVRNIWFSPFAERFFSS